MLEESGLYYLQSRYYDPNIGRFINADAFVSTGQGLLGNNMFAYCLNNPINLVDPSGTCSRFLGFLWKRDCKSTSCPESESYAPRGKKAAVIYDGRPNQSLQDIHANGLAQQGEDLVNRLSADYTTVESYPFTSMQGFVDNWNNLSGEYDTVYIIAHGDPDGLYCDGLGIGPEYKEYRYSFADLNVINVSSIHLYACDGATLNSQGDSVAILLAALTGAPVVAVSNGGVNFSLNGGYPKADGRGQWTVVTNQ